MEECKCFSFSIICRHCGTAWQDSVLCNHYILTKCKKCGKEYDPLKPRLMAEEEEDG